MRTINERWDEQSRCYNDCVKEATRRLKEGDFNGASVFTDSAARSLREMANIKQEENNLKTSKVHIIVQRIGFENGGRY